MYNAQSFNIIYIRYTTTETLLNYLLKAVPVKLVFFLFMVSLTTLSSLSRSQNDFWAVPSKLQPS